MTKTKFKSPYLRRVALEKIIYKNFRGIKLTKQENKLQDEIVELEDYGKF